MTQTLLIIIAAVLVVLVAIFAYNIHQESQFRRKIRSQFGNSDNDALMQSQTHSVRDGTQGRLQTTRPTASNAKAQTPKTQKNTEEKEKNEKIVVEPKPKAADNTLKPTVQSKSFFRNLEKSGDAVKQAAEAVKNVANKVQEAAKPVLAETLPVANKTPKIQENTETNSVQAVEEQTELTFEPVHQNAAEPVYRKPMLDLNDLSRNRLPWFDPRFDYMAYVSLRVPQELHSLPRLSNGRRFQIIGCTEEGRFQIAEPIPGVTYQAFVIGLQAISRSGLSSEQELDHFGKQVAQFAQKYDAEYQLTDIPAFLKIAQPLDDLCARVDQTIAIHLVSRTNISGTEIRNHLENKGFQLLHDGSFSYASENGNTKFSIVTLDGSAFTSSLLASQPYKGFSMLFDITRVPAGSEHFDEFMNMAIALAVHLNLDLVNDQVQELSNEWLKEICQYVLARQEEMLKVNIEPGSSLAQRLFS